jgi:hypothetical protein
MDLEERMERAGLPIEPDVLLPVQIDYLLRRSFADSGHNQSPERDLFAALLDDALRCWLGAVGVLTGNVVGHGPCRLRRSRLHAEADRWIFGDYECVVSFEMVCSLLGLDAQWIRDSLRRVVSEAKDPHRLKSVATRLPPRHVAGS